MVRVTERVIDVGARQIQARKLLTNEFSETPWLVEPDIDSAKFQGQDGGRG
jgi:hypothetical protein